MSGRSQGENALLVAEVRGEWPDRFELIERQQEVKQSLITPKVCRKASLNTQQQKITHGATPVS